MKNIKAIFINAHERTVTEIEVPNTLHAIYETIGCDVIEIINPVEYASYVEYGHRTRNHKGWVEGKFMLTVSEDEIRRSAPRILEKKLEKYLKECFK